jgi:hypothetical protein
MLQFGGFIVNILLFLFKNALANYPRGGGGEYSLRYSQGDHLKKGGH